MNRELYYDIAGISRQGFHQWMNPSVIAQERTPPELVLQMAANVRRSFLPGSGVREVYRYIRMRHAEYDALLKGWGKHTFERLCLSNGLRIEVRRFTPKTTQRGTFVFPNLIEGMLIDNINQIWASDIAYIRARSGQIIGYSTTLFDVYSRYLLGLSFSQTMQALHTSQPVMEQALQWRSKQSLQALIFHSDGGSQYIEKHFLSQLKQHQIRSSMAKNCYENPHAEALNDTLKNHMLAGLNLNSFAQLKKHEQFIKHCYNNNKTHSAINSMTPNDFEKSLLNLLPHQRTKVIIKKIN